MKKYTDNDLNRIDLLKALMQVDGKVRLPYTTHNFDLNDGIEFEGYFLDNEQKVKIQLDKQQIEEFINCNENEINDCYKKMSFFHDYKEII